MLPPASAPRTNLVHYICVVHLSLFAFLSPPDACRLLATCRRLRHDTDHVKLLLRLSPITSLVFHSRAITNFGCLPVTPTRPLHTATCGSALSVAAMWEQALLPMCYQWYNGRRLSVRLEPFLLSLPSASQSIEDVHHALELVLPGLGGAFLDGETVTDDLKSATDDVQKASNIALHDADTEEEDEAFPVFMNADSDGSEWDDSDSESDTDSELDSDSDSDHDSELDAAWLDHVASSRLEPRLHFKVYRPLLRLLNVNGFALTRWVTVPEDNNPKAGETWTSHLLVGLSPSHSVLSGVLVKARVY